MSAVNTKKRTLNRRERRQQRRKELRSRVHAHLAVHGWVPMRVSQPAAAGGFAYGMRTDTDAVIDTVNGGLHHFKTTQVSGGWVVCEWNDMRKSVFWKLRDFAVHKGMLP